MGSIYSQRRAEMIETLEADIRRIEIAMEYASNKSASCQYSDKSRWVFCYDELIIEQRAINKLLRHLNQNFI